MKPFARINLSSAALRRGSGKCENVQISNTQYQYPMEGIEMSNDIVLFAAKDGSLAMPVQVKGLYVQNLHI